MKMDIPAGIKATIAVYCIFYLEAISFIELQVYCADCDFLGGKIRVAAIAAGICRNFRSRK